jgi:hypothetical protein
VRRAALTPGTYRLPIGRGGRLGEDHVEARPRPVGEDARHGRERRGGQLGVEREAHDKRLSACRPNALRSDIHIYITCVCLFVGAYGRTYVRMHSYIYIRMYIDTCEAHMERMFACRTSALWSAACGVHVGIDVCLMEYSDMRRRDLSKHI